MRGRATFPASAHNLFLKRFFDTITTIFKRGDFNVYQQAKKGEVVNMKAFLAVPVVVCLKDGTEFLFKPMQLSHDPNAIADPNDEWAGHDDERKVRYIRRHEIDYILHG